LCQKRREKTVKSLGDGRFTMINFKFDGSQNAWQLMERKEIKRLRVCHECVDEPLEICWSRFTLLIIWIAKLFSKTRSNSHVCISDSWIRDHDVKDVMMIYAYHSRVTRLSGWVTCVHRRKGNYPNGFEIYVGDLMQMLFLSYSICDNISKRNNSPKIETVLTSCI